MKRQLFLLVLLIAAAAISPSRAQVYHKVLYLSGTQNIGNNLVTITPSGCTSYYNDTCGGSPYWIGFNGLGINCPGSYTYQFANPVTSIKVRMTYVNDNEVISFSINGTPYMLTPAHLKNYSGSCNQAAVVISGGNVFCPPGTAGARGTGAGGDIIISHPSGITSATVAANGVINMNGSSYSFFFGGIQTSSNGPLCPGDTLKLFADPIIPGATYSWTGPGGFTSTVRNPVIPHAGAAQGGVYTAIACTATDTAYDTTLVTILQVPVAGISVDRPVCAGRPLRMQGTSSETGSDFAWVGPDGFSANTSLILIDSIRDAQAGIYTLFIQAPNGCRDTDTVIIPVVHPVSRSFTAVFCANEGYDFNGTRLMDAGTHSEIFTGSNGCDSVSTVYLIALPVPEVHISYQQDPPFCYQDTILLEAAGASQYTWYHTYGTGTANGPELSLYLSRLSGNVTVVGASENECRDTAVVSVDAVSCCTLSVPNAFSPNRDGLNDHFGSVTNGRFSNYRIIICNRWGQPVYSGYDQTSYWDGNYKGVPAEIGTYYYHITATCPEGTELQRKGDLTLLR